MFWAAWIAPLKAQNVFWPASSARLDSWEEHVHEPFNERQRAIINRLFDGFEGKLSSSKWAKLAQCSQDTALRDIDDLVKRGVLSKEPGGGRSTSYALADPWER